MDKELINNKIEDLEAELQKLKQLANTPEQRTPEAGDVYQDHYGLVIILEDSIYRISRGETQDHGNIEFYKSETYLGKFDEVYVKISDVREALSLGAPGATFLDGWGNPAYDASRMALRDLNITND